MNELCVGGGVPRCGDAGWNGPTRGAVWAVCLCVPPLQKSDRYMGTSAGWSNVFKLLAPQLFSPVAKWCLLSVAVPGGMLVSGCAGHRDLSFSHAAA